MHKMTVEGILELRDQGKSWTWIDTHYGMPAGHGKNAANFLMRSKWKEQAKDVSNETVEKIKQLIIAKLDNSQIALHIGLCEKLTASVIVLHGLRRGGLGKKVSTRQGVYTFSPEFIEEVKRLADEGYNKKNITKMMGSYYDAVWNCCRLHNIEISEKKCTRDKSPYDKELERQSLYWKVPNEVKQIARGAWR